MKNFEYYNTSPNNMKINSGKILFNHMLNGIEGEDVFINDSKTSIKMLIQNTLNPMNENKEERSIQVTMDTKIKRGDYIKYTDNNEELTYMVFSKVDNHKAFLKAKMRYCNQTIMCEGQPYPIKCIADNTTYGTKGVKDNGYFQEGDARLKVWVQKNEWTDRYVENMRFIFNQKKAYEVTKIDDVVLDGIYSIEMILSDIKPGLDDIKNNIANNSDLLIPVKPNEDTPIETTTPNIIPNLEQIQVGEEVIVEVNPINTELICINGMVQLDKILEGKYKVTGLDSSSYAEIEVKINNKLYDTKYVFVY